MQKPRRDTDDGEHHHHQDDSLAGALEVLIGPITRAFLEVLEALLWGFHNSRDGRCFPSYETIAAKAGCSRDTVYEALRVLERAGVLLTWQHRIARIQVRERDLFGQWASCWRVIRTSNAYMFRDPLGRLEGVPASKSESPSGTRTTT